MEMMPGLDNQEGAGGKSNCHEICHTVKELAGTKREWNHQELYGKILMLAKFLGHTISGKELC